MHDCQKVRQFSFSQPFLLGEEGGGLINLVNFRTFLRLVSYSLPFS